MMKRLFLTWSWLCAGIAVWATVPVGYYDAALGKSDEALMTALSSIVSNHTTLSYANIWTSFKTTDLDASGHIIDMYSNYVFTYRTDQCGTYGNIGDCYNREHSFPKSWFNEASPMYTDLVHLVPTDGYVNNQRSNFPFGVCAGGTRLTNGSYYGKGRLGSSTYSGYSGTVFEPDDEYKGDFARIYFYMVTCYKDKVKTWSSPQLSSSNGYKAFSNWSINMLMEWTRMDPVSEKELKRNDGIYSCQGNRNPFVDYPELAEHIWGNKQGSAWDGSGDIDPTPMLTAPASGAGFQMGVVTPGQEQSLSVTVKGSALTENLVVDMTDNEYFSTSGNMAAADVNAGATLTVYFAGTEANGTYVDTITLRSSEVSRTFTVTVVVSDGIVALPATDVTSTSFVAHWENSIGTTGNYILWLTDTAGTMQSGYPLFVKADHLQQTVSGLTPSTTYHYYLTDSKQNFRSNIIIVTTATALRTIGVLAPVDGFIFSATAGQPSAALSGDIVTENNTQPVILSVTPGFELSVDENIWATSVEIPAEGGEFYVRMADTVAVGTVTGSLTWSSEGYESDDALTLSGTVTSAAGDVNGDGQITIADANIIISIILNGTGSADEATLARADANGDGQLTIADANTVISIILGN